MTLKDLWEHLDHMAKCRIYLEYGVDNYDEVFAGIVYDMPYWLINFELSSDDNGEAIGVEIENSDTSGKQEPVFTIYVKEV